MTTNWTSFDDTDNTNNIIATVKHKIHQLKNSHTHNSQVNLVNNNSSNGNRNSFIYDGQDSCESVDSDERDLVDKKLNKTKGKIVRPLSQNNNINNTQTSPKKKKQDKLKVKAAGKEKDQKPRQQREKLTQNNQTKSEHPADTKTTSADTGQINPAVNSTGHNSSEEGDHQNQKNQTTMIKQADTQLPQVGTQVGNATPQITLNSIYKISQEQKNYYKKQFLSLTQEPHKFMGSSQARDVLTQSGLPMDVLSKIWELSDIDRDGCLSLGEFCIAFHLTTMKMHMNQGYYWLGCFLQKI